MWTAYSVILEDILGSTSSSQASTSQHYEQNHRDVNHMMLENLDRIKSRNEAMLFRGPIAQASARLGSAVSDVKVCSLLARARHHFNVPIVVELYLR